LPYQGMFRIDVRAHSTGELVDDRRPVEQNKSQAASPTSPSGTSTSNIAWTTTVSGVLSSSRSQIRTPVAVSFSIDPNGNPGGAPPGGTPPKTGAPSS
jgi:hypothetical protein